MLPKIELATFEGKEPRAWLTNCVKYCETYRIPAKQRVQLASLILMDKVDAWFHNWKKGREPNWDEFERRICKRFGDKGLEDIVEHWREL